MADLITITLRQVRAIERIAKVGRRRMPARQRYIPNESETYTASVLESIADEDEAWAKANVARSTDESEVEPASVE